MASEYRQSGLIWLGITRIVDFQKNDNERMGYIKGAEFLDQKEHYQVLLLHGFSQVKSKSILRANKYNGNMPRTRALTHIMRDISQNFESCCRGS
jgi:hypothetical protein